MSLRPLTAEDITIELTPEDEDVRPEDCWETDDGKPDTEAAARVMAEREHNPWAWCYVKLVAKWQGLRAATGLGACSYKDEADFRANSGHMDDMVDEALDDLNRQLADMAATVLTRAEACTHEDCGANRQMALACACTFVVRGADELQHALHLTRSA